MSLWETWAAGVATGVGAPLDAVTVDTFWAWSNAETAPYALMRWNNPMNTTEPWPGSKDSGAQPGAHDVKIYATLQDGIDATVYTLTKEPYYGAIVANLRASLPRQKWGATSTAGSELHAWGTGTGWLATTPYFGAAPTTLIQGDDMTPTQEAKIDRLTALLTPLSGRFWDVGGSTPIVQDQLDAILAQATKAAAGSGAGTGGGSLTAAQSAKLDGIAADSAAIRLIVTKDLAP
jgi:hypothetical protein